nr:hypothetical protein [Tanacetum cinerariifolium]
MSMKDLYNNLKVYEPEVKGMSSSSSSTQNMAFVSSSNNNSSTNNGIVNTAQAFNTSNGVSTASTQVNASFLTNIDHLSDTVICSFFTSQPSSPQLGLKDLKQNHPDDMEEIDLRWQIAMLTMRDKRALRNQDNKHKESLRMSAPMETTNSTALVSCDGLGGYDWSDQVEDGTNFALMAFTSLNSDSKGNPQIDHLGKFDDKADEGFFVGYSLNSKAFRVFNSRTRILEKNLYIRFSENTPNVIGSRPDPNLQLMIERSLAVNAAGTNKDNKLPFDPNMPTLEDVTIFNFLNNDEGDGIVADMDNIDTTIQVSPIPTIRIHKDHPHDQVIGDFHSTTQTRNTSKNLEENRKIAIGTTWVFRNKKDERGIMIRNKVRLVTQANTQEEGIDYDEVFALVARIKAISLFIAYASFKDFMVYQMDVKSAFLYGKIEEEVYVCQPPGFEDPDIPNIFYKLEKSLYGLHQHSRAWSTKIGLWYPKDFPLDLEAYSDSDYARASLDRKSTTGGCQFLRAKTINGEAHIHSRVDGKKVRITEASIRRDVQLADEEGVDCLPISIIFEQLDLIGYEKVPQSGDSMEHVVDEVVHKELGDSLVRATTTASSLEVEQDNDKEMFDADKDLGGEEVFVEQEVVADKEKIDEVTLAKALAELQASKPKAKRIVL